MEKSITKFEQIRRQNEEAVEAEFYFLPESTKNILKTASLQRLIDRLVTK
jgi:hypothetical protein